MILILIFNVLNIQIAKKNLSFSSLFIVQWPQRPIQVNIL